MKGSKLAKLIALASLSNFAYSTPAEESDSSAVLLAAPWAVIGYEIADLPPPVIDGGVPLNISENFHGVSQAEVSKALTNHFTDLKDVCTSGATTQAQRDAIKDGLDTCTNQGKLKDAWSSLKEALDCVQDHSVDFELTYQRGAVGAGMRVALQLLLDFWTVHYGNLINLDIVRKAWGNNLSILPCVLDFVFYEENHNNGDGTYVMGNDIELSGLVKPLFDLTQLERDLTLDDFIYLWGYYYDVVLLGPPADLPAKFSIGKCNLSPNLKVAVDNGATANWHVLGNSETCTCDQADADPVAESLDQWIMDRVQENEDALKEVIDVLGEIPKLFAKSIFSHPVLQPMVCPGSTTEMIPVEWLYECPNKVDIDAFAEVVLEVLQDGLDSGCNGINEDVCGADILLFPILGKLSASSRQVVRPLVEYLAKFPKDMLSLISTTCSQPPVDPAKLDIKGLQAQGEIIFYSAVGLGAALGVSLIANVAQAVVGSKSKSSIPSTSNESPIAQATPVEDTKV